MTLNSILRIDEDASPVCLYTYDAQNNSCTKDVITEWKDSKLSAKELIILVPASWVYHSQVQVASKNIEILNKSIPFAIEEELSNEVDDNYFAFKINTDGTQQVIAIEKKHLDHLLQILATHQLTVGSIHSEVHWVPQHKNKVNIWSDAESSLLNIGVGQSMRVANHQIEQLLPVFAQDMKAVVCNQTSKINYTALPIEESLNETICCQTLLNNTNINLYIDEVKNQESEEQANSWKSVYGLIAVLLLSWVVIQSIQWISLNQSIEEISNQQKELFRQNYPNAVQAELVDPFAALQSRLKIQNAQSATGPNILIDAVDQIGKSLQTQPVVKLVGLRMVDQKIELQIVAPSMTVINGFHQLLQNNASQFTVQIGVNELGDDQIFKSILTMVPR